MKSLLSKIFVVCTNIFILMQFIDLETNHARLVQFATSDMRLTTYCNQTECATTATWIDAWYPASSQAQHQQIAQCTHVALAFYLACLLLLIEIVRNRNFWKYTCTLLCGSGVLALTSAILLFVCQHVLSHKLIPTVVEFQQVEATHRADWIYLVVGTLFTFYSVVYFVIGFVLLHISTHE